MTLNEKFIEMITPMLPEWDIEGFSDACRRPLKKSITINTWRISVEDFKELVEPMGWILTPHEFSNPVTSFYIDRENVELALGNTFLYKCGFFYIQELAASMPAHLVNVQPWDLVLDIAAAPWGKTSQLANALLGQSQVWLIVANDIASSRIKTLAHNLNLWGFYNSAITRFNGFAFGKNVPEMFNHVLVDAPCSGEWTAFKSDMALKHWKIEEINKIAGTQFQMLCSAIKATKVWGTIIYSTCTLNPYENEVILARVMEFFKGAVELVSVQPTIKADKWISYSDDDYTFDATDNIQRFWPHRQWTWGFFVSKLKKVASIMSEQTPQRKHENKLAPKNQFKLESSKRLQKSVAKYLKDFFGVVVDVEKEWFVATKDKVYLVSPDFLRLQKDLHFEKAWVPVFKIDRGEMYRPTHYAGLIFGARANRHVMERSDEDIQAYVLGKLLPADHKPTIPYQMITWRGYGMSVTKWVEGDWKNKYGK